MKTKLLITLIVFMLPFAALAEEKLYVILLDVDNRGVYSTGAGGPLTKILDFGAGVFGYDNRYLVNANSIMIPAEGSEDRGTAGIGIRVFDTESDRAILRLEIPGYLGREVGSSIQKRAIIAGTPLSLFVMNINFDPDYPSRSDRPVEILKVGIATGEVEFIRLPDELRVSLINFVLLANGEVGIYGQRNVLYRFDPSMSNPMVQRVDGLASALPKDERSTVTVPRTNAGRKIRSDRFVNVPEVGMFWTDKQTVLSQISNLQSNQGEPIQIEDGDTTHLQSIIFRNGPALAYATSNENDEVVRIIVRRDAESTPLVSKEVPFRAEQLIFSPDGSRAYMFNIDKWTITSYDLNTGEFADLPADDLILPGKHMPALLCAF